MPRIDTPEHVKSARKQLGLTQAGLAALLRLGKKNGADTVRAWESGKRNISGPAQVALECLLYGDPQDG